MTSKVTLQLALREGRIDNRFLRAGPIAAHVVSRSGLHPRLLVAFPACNEGVGLWFERQPEAAQLTVGGAVDPVEDDDGLYGIAFDLHADAAELVEQRILLGGVRLLRHANHGRSVPEGLEGTVRSEQPLRIERRLLDGRRLVLQIEPRSSTVLTRRPTGELVLQRNAAAAIHFRLTALTEATPLTPIAAEQLLREGHRPRSKAEERDLQALAFLAYEEKLLAGSWRFLTYFGRDTLMTICLMMEALQPRVVEAGLGAVCARLGPHGEVAHEEDIGDSAALRRQPAGAAAELGPALLDYKMVDDDFMLAPVAARYLLDTAEGRQRAAAFLARRAPSGETYAALLRRNAKLVLARARSFAEQPASERLIALPAGQQVGQWRDSYEGLGGGRVPYDVNAVLVPAALAAAQRLLAGPLGEPQAAHKAAHLAQAWGAAAAMFEVQLPAHTARERVLAYAAEVGIDPAPALQSLDEDGLAFAALALDEQGRPLPVMHSDGGYALLFCTPAAEQLEQLAALVTRPFPAGLRTPAGLVVANAALVAEPSTRALFSRDHYHGAVVWSWHQAMWAAGLRRQLERSDLPPRTRERLGDAERLVWQAIDETASLQSSEVWSWHVVDGKLRVQPFGQAEGHHSESNAAQLWSTAFLGIRRPGG